MNITFSTTRKDGKHFEHLPLDQRPVTMSVVVRDDDGGVYLFRSSEDQTITAYDWYDATIDGKRYTNSDAWHDTPVGYIHDEPNPTVAVYFAYGGEATAEDVMRIADAIRFAILMSAGYTSGNLIQA